MATEITLYDERQGIPSASRLLRLKLCPGSFWMEYNKRSSNQNQSTPDADRGTRIHAAAKEIAMDEEKAVFDENITREEIEEAQKLYNIYQGIRNDVFPGVEGFSQKIIEERFWMNYGEWEPILTGQIDIGEIQFNAEEKVWEALICDYKTGWNEVTPAEANLQMRGYAVLLKANHPELKRITVAVISPNTGKPTITRYEAYDLALAKDEVAGILMYSLVDPEAPLTAGTEQCKYCPAKTKCPEYRREFLAPVPMVRDFTLSAEDWTPELRVRFCEVLPEIKKWVDGRTAEIKELARLGEIPGWAIGNGRKIQKIKDPQEAYRRVSKLLSADQFTESCSVSLPKLRKIYAKAREVTETEAKYHLAEKLAGLIEETETEGQLEKIK